MESFLTQRAPRVLVFKQQKAKKFAFKYARIALSCSLLSVASFSYATSADFKNTDFAAAAPFTYDPTTGGGAYNDRTVGDDKDVTEQLEGGEFSCGDVVSYLAQIVMEDNTVEAIQTGRFGFKFLANSTGQSGAAHATVLGVHINYGDVENGDDGTGVNPGEGMFGIDSGISDDGGSEAVLVSQSLTGPLFQSGSELLATVDVTDLEAGEKVVLRIDTLLSCEEGSSPTGNLQGQLDSGITFPTEQTINTGQQTIPFLKVGDILGAGEPLVNIEKTVTTAQGTCGVDDTEVVNVFAGDTVKYCFKVTNDGSQPLYDVSVVDNNGTAGEGNEADDFTITINELENLDGDNDLGDLSGVTTVYGEALVTLPLSEGTITNTVTVTGNNGLSGGNFQQLSDVDSANVIMELAPNNPPMASPDSAFTDEDTAVVIDVLANDVDVDGNLNIDSISLTAQPLNGTVVINGDGTVTYIPNENFYGSDTFAYQVCDFEGECSSTSVTVQVSAINDPPVAVDDTLLTDQDVEKTVLVTSNDSDIDGDVLYVSIITAPANGQVVNNGNGSITYIPDPNFFGTDSIVYEVCDDNNLCDTATVFITVIENVVDPSPPIAEDDSAATNEDTSLLIDVTENDSDVDGNLDPNTTNVNCQSCTLPDNGTLTNNGDGTFTYLPNNDFNGNDSFVYEVCDTDDLCALATVSITINSVNDVPVAEDDNVTTLEDVAIAFDVTTNDTDADNNLDLNSVNTDCELCSLPNNGQLTNNGDGTFVYSSDQDFNGTDSFTYEVCDTDGSCDLAVVVITVQPVNDPPVALDDNFTVDEDVTLQGNVLVENGEGVDFDTDGNLDSSSVISLSGPTNGLLSLNTDGSFAYVPQQDYFGTDSFIYQVCDTDNLCDTATATIIVLPVNDPPLALDDSVSTPEDIAVMIFALSNDSDVDENLDSSTTNVNCESCTLPSNGTLTNNGDGTFTYLPYTDFNGNDSFVYEVCDSEGLCSQATVNILVSSEDDPPVAVDDSVLLLEDTSAVIQVSSNDSDVDNNLDETSTQVIVAPVHGTLTKQDDGSFIYTPTADYAGNDQFKYEICDTTTPIPLCDSATVFIEVTPVNDPPEARDDTFITTQDTAISVDSPALLANDSDIDGDVISVVDYESVGEFGGSISVNPDGSFIYDPAAGFAGVDSFSYTITDGQLESTAEVTIVVEARNNRSISLDLVHFDIAGNILDGQLLITNQSDGYNVQVDNLELEVQYKVRGQRWSFIAITPDSCEYNPEPLFMVVNELSVSFQGCLLEEDIPEGATVRVTAKVHIFGRINGKGKSDGWFTDRLSY